MKKFKFKQSNTNHRNGAGFTLTELLVIVVIFGLVSGAVYAAFTLSQRAYREGERAAEITQNGRVIIERMTREIRQARKIVTPFPKTEAEATSTIKFQDGHLVLVTEEATAQGGSTSTITLAATASKEKNFYNNMFIKITGGMAVGQIKKIVGYNGINKIAEIEGSWEVIPDSTSTYKIDTSYYYIHYFRDDFNNVWRRVIAYYFSGNPCSWVVWDAIPPTGQTLEIEILEAPRLIGEYVTNLKFWGPDVINIFITLTKVDKQINLLTKIFGRNLWLRFISKPR